MTTTPKSVSIEKLIKQIRRSMRSGRVNYSSKVTMTMAQKALKDWGVFEIYKDKVLRDMVSESIAARLNLSVAFVKDRMDSLSRSVKYDQERNDPGLEG